MLLLAVYRAVAHLYAHANLFSIASLPSISLLTPHPHPRPHLRRRVQQHAGGAVTSPLRAPLARMGRRRHGSAVPPAQYWNTPLPSATPPTLPAHPDPARPRHAQRTQPTREGPPQRPSDCPSASVRPHGARAAPPLAGWTVVGAAAGGRGVCAAGRARYCTACCTYCTPARLMVLYHTVPRGHSFVVRGRACAWERSLLAAACLGVDVFAGWSGPVIGWVCGLYVSAVLGRRRASEKRRRSRGPPAE